MTRQFRAVRPYSGEGVPGEVDYHLGNALYRLGQLASAVEAWRACAAKCPEFAPVHNNLAVGLLSLGRLEEARDSAATAERLGMPLHPKLRARLSATLDGS
jgi:Flp pilus assembly protein TadD